MRRNHNVYDDIPVPVEAIVELRLDISIVPIPNIQERYNKVGWISTYFTEITVDQFIVEHRSGRYRFTLAHELGHFILHGDYIRSLEIDSSKDWRTVVEEIDREALARLEIQANHFAGLLLIPDAHLDRYWNDIIFRTGEITTYKGLDADCRGMADTYDVSPEAVQKRLKHSKLVDWLNND